MTKGVLPVPPVVILPMLITGTVTRLIFSHPAEYRKLRMPIAIAYPNDIIRRKNRAIAAATPPVWPLINLLYAS